MSSNDNGYLFEAAASGDLEYIKQNIKLVNEKNERGWTPLHFAARFGQKEIAMFLKDNNADLTILNNEGKTAGQLALFWGNDEIAKVLTVEQPKEAQQQLIKGSPFPDNYETMFAGNPLNRFGWNRTKPEFLSSLAHSPKAKYLILNNLQALYNNQGNLQFLTYNDVSSIVDRLFTKNGIHESITDIILVFLGVDETQGKGEEGEGYWAIDLTPQGTHEKQYSQLIQDFESKGYEFSPTIPRAFVSNKKQNALIAQAASMVDWNARHKYCPACGKQTVLLEAGYKRSCPLDDTKCISHKGVQNFCYPRTDPVVIVCIVHPDGDKILLGRSKRFPRKMYSCLSGFVEAAETLEEAVRREAFEEVGIVVDRVAYHSSQPWPFPNSLMLGFIAEAVSTDISFADDELESAAWFTRSEVLAAIKGEKGASFFIPSKGALASTLVRAWLYDKKWQTSHAKL